jgi:hypothetical protein
MRYTVGLAETRVLSARSATGRRVEYMAFAKRMVEGRTG